MLPNSSKHAIKRQQQQQFQQHAIKRQQQQQEYTRQNGENVNPFGAIASMAGDRSGPWTGWIGPAPV